MSLRCMTMLIHPTSALAFGVTLMYFMTSRADRRYEAGFDLNEYVTYVTYTLPLQGVDASYQL